MGHFQDWLGRDGRHMCRYIYEIPGLCRTSGSTLQLADCCRFTIRSVVCFCRMTIFQIHLEDPDTVKTARNKRNNKLCDVWLSCLDSLALGVMDRLGTMEQCPGASGGYVPPGRAALLFGSDIRVVFSNCHR